MAEINKTNQMVPSNANGKYSSGKRRKKKSKWYIARMKARRTLHWIGGKIATAWKKIDRNDVRWFLDIRKWIPILMVAFIIVYSIGYFNGKAKVKEEITVEAEIIPIDESEVFETDIIDVDETEPTSVEEEKDEEAVALAILADTSARGRSEEVKKILMWVAINRTEDHKNGYGGTLLEEIARPRQWQQYDPEGMYLEATYDLALEVLTIWRNNGPRPLYNDMLWSVYNGDGTITVRNKFKDTKGRVEQTFG